MKLTQVLAENLDTLVDETSDWFIRQSHGDIGQGRESDRPSSMKGKKDVRQGREGVQKIRGRLAPCETAKGGLSDNACHLSTERSFLKKVMKLGKSSSRGKTF